MQLTNSSTDQLMALAAQNYCLQQKSYMVGMCIEWLREIWPQLTTETQNLVLRDTVDALQARCTEEPAKWGIAALWMWHNMSDDQQWAWLRQQPTNQEETGNAEQRAIKLGLVVT